MSCQHNDSSELIRYSVSYSNGSQPIQACLWACAQSPVSRWCGTLLGPQQVSASRPNLYLSISVTFSSPYSGSSAPGRDSKARSSSRMVRQLVRASAENAGSTYVRGRVLEGSILTLTEAGHTSAGSNFTVEALSQRFCRMALSSLAPSMTLPFHTI